MEADIAADIVSGKIKPKTKRKRQPKSAKEIDEDETKIVRSRQSPLHLLVLLAAFSFRSPACSFQPTYYYNACSDLFFLILLYVHMREINAAFVPSVWWW
jgi:hypothetical protein